MMHFVTKKQEINKDATIKKHNVMRRFQERYWSDREIKRYKNVPLLLFAVLL